MALGPFVALCENPHASLSVEIILLAEMNYKFSMRMKCNKPELVIERKEPLDDTVAAPLHLLLQVKPKNESRPCELKGCDLCNNCDWNEKADLRKHGWYCSPLLKT